MNKELIKKYKTEFDHWLKEGKLLYNCGQSWIECLKSFRWDNDVRNDLQFIINDEYVEFRKAIAEGKTIQVNNLFDESWTDIKDVKFTGNVKMYRIKPEEPQFKVGDWVRMVNCTIVKNQKEIFCINFIDSKNNCFGINADIEYCNTNYLELWKPKIGEWVIPDTGIDDKMFVVMRYDGTTLIADRCQPFIGELPK